MKRITTKLRVSAETIRTLAPHHLIAVAGGGPSGSQGGSATCPPPKNGEGSGCLTL